ncbi:hypothetical protein JCM19992_28520 [Thermostilla marina]
MPAWDKVEGLVAGLPPESAAEGAAPAACGADTAEEGKCRSSVQTTTESATIGKDSRNWEHGCCDAIPAGFGPAG